MAQPHYYHDLRRELDRVFPDPTADIDINALTDLPLLNGIINETLRLGSPFFLPRVVPSGGAVIGDIILPGNTIVALAAYSQQTSPDNFYPEPKVSFLSLIIDSGFGVADLLNI